MNRELFKPVIHNKFHEDIFKTAEYFVGFRGAGRVFPEQVFPSFTNYESFINVFSGIDEIKNKSKDFYRGYRLDLMIYDTHYLPVACIEVDGDCHIHETEAQINSRIFKKDMFMRGKCPLYEVRKGDVKVIFPSGGYLSKTAYDMFVCLCVQVDAFNPNQQPLSYEEFLYFTDIDVFGSYDKFLAFEKEHPDIISQARVSLAQAFSDARKELLNETS